MKQTILTMKQRLENDQIRSSVQARYGAIAAGSDRRSCCGGGGVLESGTEAARLGYTAEETGAIPDGADMGLGCGNPTAIASIQPGESVLDLGSGAGFDCFLAARKTGPQGRVIGVDMTAEMIHKAREHAAKGDFHQVEFRLGEIEQLPVADGIIDLIISNCVINLSPDKPQVFAEARRVLKPGGRIAVSDVVTLQPLPEDLKANVEAYSGCVAGASSAAEVEGMLLKAGFRNVQVEIQEKSRDFINEWIPGHCAGEYVASAIITATK